MKLLSKTKIKLFQLSFLDFFGLIETTELWVLIDIFESIVDDIRFDDFREEEVVAIELCYINPITNIEVKLTTKSGEDIILPVGVYGCDDYFFIDLPNALSRIFSITKSKKNNFEFNFVY